MGVGRNNKRATQIVTLQFVNLIMDYVKIIIIIIILISIFIWLKSYFTKEEKGNSFGSGEKSGIPNYQLNIIGLYGAVLEKKENQGIYLDENLLPVKKEELFNIFKNVYSKCLDSPEKDVLEIFTQANSKKEALEFIRAGVVLLSRFADHFTAINFKTVDDMSNNLNDKKLMNHYDDISKKLRNESKYYVEELDKIEQAKNRYD